MLLKGGLVVDRDGGCAVADVRIDGRVISAVQPELEAHDGEPIVDASRRLVVPGLVNAHYHSNEGFLRGSYDALPLEAWLAYAYPFTNNVPYTERDLYLRTAVGAIELLASGTTTVVDFLYELPHPTLETLRPVVEAYRDVGIRTVLALSIWDLPWPDTVPLRLDLIPDDLRTAVSAPAPPATQWLDLCRDLIGELPPESAIAVGLAPSGPQRCSDDLLRDLRMLADERDLALHTHCLETRLQAYTGESGRGRTLVEHLAELGVLGSRVSLAHGIWLTASDVDLLARHEATVVHNPQANLKLGDGRAPIPQLLRAGVNVALGTDGMSTNDTRDMYEALKLAAILHRTQDPDFDHWITAATAWRMATVGGARSANWPGIGVIEAGANADLVLLDLDDVAFTPLNEPLYHLVYSMPSHAVREAYVDGRCVLRDGRVTLVDGVALLAEMRERGDLLRPARAAAHTEGPRLMPALREVYERAQFFDPPRGRWAAQRDLP